MDQNKAIHTVLEMLDEQIKELKPTHNNIFSSDFTHYAMLLDARSVVHELLDVHTITIESKNYDGK